MNVSPLAGSNPIPFESVKSFGIAVPNVNLPPTVGNGITIHNGDDMGFTEAETMFDYYFSLKLRNGSTVDFPAGHTVFVPSSPPLRADRTNTSVTVPVERPKSDYQGHFRVLSIANCVICHFYMRLLNLTADRGILADRRQLDSLHRRRSHPRRSRFSVG